MSPRRKRGDPDARIDALSERPNTLEWWLDVRGPRNDAAIDRDLEQSCTRKDRYPTREAARAVAAMNGMADALHVYECRYCLQWHLTRRRV